MNYLLPNIILTTFNSVPFIIDIHVLSKYNKNIGMNWPWIIKAIDCQVCKLNVDDLFDTLALSRNTLNQQSNFILLHLHLVYQVYQLITLTCFFVVFYFLEGFLNFSFFCLSKLSSFHVQFINCLWQFISLLLIVLLIKCNQLWKCIYIELVLFFCHFQFLYFFKQFLALFWFYWTQVFEIGNFVI